MNNVIFFIFWLLANVIGFILGSYLGATNDGFATKAIPGYLGLILGDLVFGASIGLAQYLAFWLAKYKPMKATIWWIVLTSIGFTLGARTGSLLTYRVLDFHDGLEPSLVFGVFMGGSIGLATYFSFNRVIQWKNLLWWVFVSIVAWVFGEGVAFEANFSQDAVLHVALTIGGITGLELVRLQYISSRRNKVKVVHNGSKPPVK